MGFSQFSGTFALLSYSTTVFKDSGSDFDPYISSIIFTSLQIFGTYCTSLLIDRVGRKVLLIVSASGASVGLATMATFSYFHKYGYDVSAFNLVPVISLSFFIFISSVGLIPIPYVIIAEVLPRKVCNPK